MKMSGLRSTAAELLRYISAALLIIMLSLSCAKNGGVDDPEDPKKPGTEQPDKPDDPAPDEPEPEIDPYIPPVVTDHVIGYLVYTSFEHDFFDTLLEAFDDFKSAGVTDLILDLRYNGGGHVVSSQGLASIIAGPWCKDKVFAYERFNDERMKKLGCDPKNYKTYDYRMFFNDLADRYSFSFSKFYVIISRETASASELLINALRGIGYDVVVVGNENSIGKDVGMEVPREEKIGDYYYQPVVISFQSYNAQGKSDYNDGFAPDLTPSEDYRQYIPWDWGIPAEHGLYLKDEYNSLKKFSNDYLTEILLDINGGNDLSYDNIEVVSSTAKTDTRTLAARDMQLHKKTQISNQLNVRSNNPLKSNMVIFRDDMDLPSTRAMTIPKIKSDPVKDWIDPWMDNYYLWNDSYRTCTKNYNLSAEKFLDNMLNQMRKKGANLHDGFQDGTTWYFFSYVDIWPAVGSRSEATTRGKESSDKWDQIFKHPKTLGFGLDLQPVYLSNKEDLKNRIGFMVNGVYRDSPAAKAGIVRGDIILKINGTAITNSNYTNYVNLLYDEFSTTTTYTFTLWDGNSLNDLGDGEEITVTNAEYEQDPVIYKSIYRFIDRNE